MARSGAALLGALKPYATLTDHPLAVIDGRVASAQLKKHRYLDKLATDDAAIAVLNELVHVDFSGSKCVAFHTEDPLWQKLAMRRGRCLEGVHPWCFAKHASGAWLEHITQLRNFGFVSSGDLTAATAMLETLQRKLPALEVLECTGIGAQDALLLEDVVGGAKLRVTCELRFDEQLPRPLQGIEVRRPDTMDHTWLDQLLTVAAREAS